MIRHPFTRAVCFLVLLSGILLSCDPARKDPAQKKAPAQKKKTDWRLTLSSDDKGPYGISIASKTIPFYFPAAKRKDLRSTNNYTSISRRIESGDSVSLLVMVGFRLGLNEEDWGNLLAFAGAGNEVVIFSSRPDSLILNYFNVGKQGSLAESYGPPLYNLEQNRNALRLEKDSSNAYGYTGRHIRSYFSWDQNRSGDPDREKKPAGDLTADDYTADDDEDDAVVPEVLGRSEGHVNFMRYSTGAGHITLHAAPLAISNYFLLQPGNRAYLDGIWQTLPANINRVYWQEYYNREAENPASGLGILWRHPATRAALLLFLAGMLLYVLFSMKRRQRIIPIVKPVENTSVQFVETIGRLYYNQGVHSNLAEKMTQHFMEWVRSVYYLDTSVLNDVFIRSLAAKSGLPEEHVHRTVLMLHQARIGEGIDEDYLYQLHTALEKFYSRHPYSLL